MTKLISPLLVCLLIGTQSFAQSSKSIKDIGGEISEESARNWTSAFVAAHPTEIQGYVMGRNIISGLLASEGVDGLYIFNGLDETGTLRLIYLPSNADGEVPPGTPPSDNGKVCPPTCSFSNIEEIGASFELSVAEQWMRNYKTKYPGRPQGQLFGSIILTQILNQEQVKGLVAINAIKETGEQCLVLAGVNRDGDILWNMSGDKSTTCPPYCPKSIVGESIVKK